ncbi:hypothetical protein [Streptomyces hoynatensis]|uniref:Secreted protein n=1 Tax=Streptomyces hoynatensis TaxID=1141874 RepID=A0A3A9ZFD4_9ACTN|nr:hypothetical protein [Streptomyces hoynatensis]RKN46929.1 hypothetical protein D7294_01630 [Streptomyces hoynatensis]
MDGLRSNHVNRRPLVCAMVAAGVLCLVWLLPTAHPDGDGDAGGSVIPVEQPHFDLDQGR